MENIIISIMSGILSYLFLSIDKKKEEKSDINENVKLQLKI